MNRTVRLSSLLTVLLLSACGSGGATSRPSAQPSPAAASPSTAAVPPSTAAASPSTPAQPGVTVSAILRDFEIELDALEVTASFRVDVMNEGPTPHDFTIRDASGAKLATSGELTRLKTGSVDVPALAPGEYTYFCSLPGHESLGMKGTLTVTE